MEYDFAPMEGVTSCIYRNIHAELFGGVRKYYAPFIAPDGSGNFKLSALRDVMPENNRSVTLVPQILCSRPEPFLHAARELAAMGYSEVNLNAGCPSGTVVSKHKGAGMLLDLRSLDDFLADVFERCPIRISIKTRLGIHTADEFPAILEIYNKYPLSELIIHARVRDGMYKSIPDIESFKRAFAVCRSNVSYNGDIFTPAKLDALKNSVPELCSVMIGRGAAANPALFRHLNGGTQLTVDELRIFHDTLADAFVSAVGEHFALARLKELWYYMIYLFTDCTKVHKQLNKSVTLSDYRSAVEMLFSTCIFDPEKGFHG